MPPTIRLIITTSEIRLELPAPAEPLRYANHVAYNPDRLSVLTYGKSETELKKELGRDWSTFRQKAVFTRLFDPQTRGPVFDYHVVESILSQARQRIFPQRIGRDLPLPWNAVEIEAQIQDYDQLSLGRRLELEYFLQDFQQARRLSINGTDRTILPAWRTTQALLGLLLRTLPPVFLLYAGMLALTRQWDQGWLPAALGLLGGLGGALLAYLLGTVLWLLLLRAYLPHSYLRYQLRSSRSWLRGLTKWIADRLLN